MTETQTSIRHHHNAKFHLRRFAGDDGRVWRYDRTGEYTAEPKAPRGIGYEDLLYAPKDGGPDANSDAWEKWLGVIDSRASAHVPRLEREERLNRRQRSHISAYVAAQDLRTPLSRDQFTSAVQSGLDSWWGDVEQIKREIKDSQGVEYESAELAEYLNATSPSVTNAVWLAHIGRMVDPVGGRLYTYPWTIVRIPPGHELLLNDLGIVKFRGSWARPAPFTLGWSGDCHHWLIPLSPSRALAIAPDNTLGWFQVLPAWVAVVNERIVLDAHRYVYSRRFESSVQECWDRTKGA